MIAPVIISAVLCVIGMFAFEPSNDAMFIMLVLVFVMQGVNATIRSAVEELRGRR